LQIQDMSLGFYSNIGRAAFGSIKTLSRLSAQGIKAGQQNIRLPSQRKLAATGVLAPGDPNPPPDGPPDFYGYRGVATLCEIGHLKNQPFSLGKLIDLRGGPTEEIRFSLDTLKRHAAVIGRTGALKTKSVLVPWISAWLRAGCSAVAIDIGGDLIDDLMVHRSATVRCGAKVSIWDYSQPNRSAGWNWIAALDDDEAVVAAVDALHGKLRANDSQPHFHQRDARLLRGLLELARDFQVAKNGRELLHLAQYQGRLQRLISMHPSHSGAARLADVVSLLEYDYRQAISGVINDLEIWDNVRLDAVSAQSGIDIDQLFSEPPLLIVRAPIHNGRISGAASGLILSQVINLLYRRFTSPSARQVFLFIDEAARLANRLPLEELVSVSRKAKISVILSTQDVGQLDESERVTLLGTCATYISLADSSKSNGEYLASRLGERFQSSVSLSNGGGASPLLGSSRTISNTMHSVPVLGQREILDPPWGEHSAAVHSQPVSNRPFLVDLSRPEFM